MNAAFRRKRKEKTICFNRKKPPAGSGIIAEADIQKEHESTDP